MTDGLPDGLTDESNNGGVHMEGNFPKIWTFEKYHTAMLIGIFTVILADGWTDRTDDGHTDRKMDFQLESCFG